MLRESCDCVHFVKSKIANTPILKHFDPDRIPEIVVYDSFEGFAADVGWHILASDIYKSDIKAK